MFERVVSRPFASVVLRTSRICRPYGSLRLPDFFISVVINRCIRGEQFDVCPRVAPIIEPLPYLDKTEEKTPRLEEPGVFLRYLSACSDRCSWSATSISALVICWSVSLNASCDVIILKYALSGTFFLLSSHIVRQSSHEISFCKRRQSIAQRRPPRKRKPHQLLSR